MRGSPPPLAATSPKGKYKGFFICARMLPVPAFRLLDGQAICREFHVTSASGGPLVQTRGGSYDEGLANGHRLLEQHPSVALQQAETLLRSGPEPRALQLAAAALRRLSRNDEAEQ